jgi:hypothetical protein
MSSIKHLIVLNGYYYIFCSLYFWGITDCYSTNHCYCDVFKDPLTVLESQMFSSLLFTLGSIRVLYKEHNSKVVIFVSFMLEFLFCFQGSLVTHTMHPKNGLEMSMLLLIFAFITHFWLE